MSETGMFTVLACTGARARPREGRLAAVWTFIAERPQQLSNPRELLPGDPRPDSDQPRDERLVIGDRLAGGHSLIEEPPKLLHVRRVVGLPVLPVWAGLGRLEDALGTLG